MEKVYVLGATGNIGTHVVQQLLKKNIAVTAYVRDVTKASNMLPTTDLLTLVTGPSFENDMTTFQQTIQGHTRLFLLVAGFMDYVKVKSQLASMAYDAGVQQIVDLSSQYVGGTGWRSNHVGFMQRQGEEALFKLSNDSSSAQTVVTLRPSGFFTNQLWNDALTLKRTKNIISSPSAPNEKLPMISVRDIATVATTIFSEPIEKHAGGVYELTSVMLSGNDRATIFSKVLDRPISFQQVPVMEQYTFYADQCHFPHLVAYSLASDTHSNGAHVSDGLSILLGRQPETMEEWLESVKDHFQT